MKPDDGRINRVNLVVTTSSALLLLVALLGAYLTSGCGRSPQSSLTDESTEVKQESSPTRGAGFFVEWLKNHGESNVVVDASGVGLSNNPVRLSVALANATTPTSGVHTVELTFRVRLGSARQVIEHVAGMGETHEKAVNDAYANFVLTTFHPIYKAFLNPADPHLQKQEIPGAVGTRQLLAGDLYVRSNRSDGTNGPDLNAIRPEIVSAVASLPLSPASHWVKIVYAQMRGKLLTVEATVDNQVHPVLTETVRNLGWPMVGEFYFAKEFLIIRPPADPGTAAP